jgi:hypothetical protein
LKFLGGKEEERERALTGDTAMTVHCVNLKIAGSKKVKTSTILNFKKCFFSDIG